MGVITSGQTLTGKVGVAFSQTPAYTGTISSWALASGSSLPSDLSLNGTSGLISGTPTTKGAFNAVFSYSLARFIAIDGNIALREDGTVFTWAHGAWGDSIIPPELSSVTAISSGWPAGYAGAPEGVHFLALKSNGTVVAWGINTYGQASVPAGLLSVTAVAAGAEHSLALKSDGTVVAWGRNNVGQVSVPSGLSGVIAVSAARTVSYALKSDGTVVGWGGQDILFGTGAFWSGVVLSNNGVALSNIVKIDAGYTHLLAIKTNGTVVASGNNSYGQSSVPAGLSNVIKVYGNQTTSFAIKSDGTVVYWGRDGGGGESSGVVTLSSGGVLSGIVAMGSGLSAVVALNSDGFIRQRESGAAGELGFGEIENFFPYTTTASIAFTITDGVPIITAGQTASGKVGTAFSKTFWLTDSTNRPVTSWAATGLPSWATLNTATGAITGTPLDSGNSTITLTATGPGGTSAATTATISIAAGPPIITAGQSFTGKVGVAFSQTPALEDALDRPATSWSVTGLPAGLALNTTTGAITGTPTAKGSFTASFTATGGGGASTATSISFTIADGVPIITAGQTASGKVGTAFSKTFSLTDSTNRPVTSWSATGLPAGLSINASTGAITGTPQDGGSYTTTLTATGPGGTDTETVVISIVEDLDLSVSLSAAAVVATSLVIDYRAALAGVTALDAGGSWELYRDVEPIFLGESRWGGSPGVQEPGFVTIDLVRFVWGEFDIVRGFTGRVGVFCFTTLDGRITPEPLVQVGLRFLEGRGAERLQYRAAFTGPGRPFDYVSVPEDGSVIEDEIVITEGRAYGVYNIWATENLPPGQVKVHFSVHLYRDA